MSEINGIKINNNKTYVYLKSIFKDKKPTKSTVLLMRLYFDKVIDKDELMIFNEVQKEKQPHDINNKKNHGISGIKMLGEPSSDSKNYNFF